MKDMNMRILKSFFFINNADQGMPSASNATLLTYIYPLNIKNAHVCAR
jgi:hypothetical protein